MVFNILITFKFFNVLLLLHPRFLFHSRQLNNDPVFVSEVIKSYKNKTMETFLVKNKKKFGILKFKEKTEDFPFPFL